MSRSLASFALISALFAAACGGATPAVEPPPAGSATPDATAAPVATTVATAAPVATTAPVATAAPVATTAPVADPHAGTTWRDDMTKEQKMAFMKARVSPEMAKTFQAYDAKKYGDFGCKSCHGPQYKAPKDFLPKLTMKGGTLTAFADKPEVSKFMAAKVTPQMAALFGKAPYDPATQKGFGCGGCHTIDMAK